MTPILIAWNTRVGEDGQWLPGRGEVLDQPQSDFRTVDTVDAQDLGVVMRELCEGDVQRHAVREKALVIGGERADGRTVMKGLFYVKSEDELIEILKSLQEYQIDAALEQGPNLHAEAILTVDASPGRLSGGYSKRTDTASYERSLCHLSGKLRRLPVDFIDVI